jgi:hypothetical protein
MTESPHRPGEHEHRAVTKRVLKQRDGIPYQVELTFCSDCARLIAERPLRRAAA